MYQQVKIVKSSKIYYYVTLTDYVISTRNQDFSNSTTQKLLDQLSLDLIRINSDMARVSWIIMEIVDKNTSNNLSLSKS